MLSKSGLTQEKEQKMEKNKEDVLDNYLFMISKSWTYKRLTKNERKNVKELLINANPSGTYEERYGHLQEIYYKFLLSLGYTPPCWRE